MISVIIPTLNEEDNLDGLLSTLFSETNVEYEIIIVDGGSTDNTSNIASSHPVTFFQSPQGRGQQLCAGAEKANGDVILFLHADSKISHGMLSAIQNQMNKHLNIIGGNFKLLFDGEDSFSTWLNDFYAKLRSWGVYYGDSGIFIRKAVLDEIGGLRNIALMEDYDLIRRMERFGLTCNIIDPMLITSSRRFLGRNKWLIILGWIKIHILYYLGCGGGFMARQYDSIRITEHNCNRP